MNLNVKEVNLSDNQIGEKGAITLAEAFKVNSSIRVVYLSGYYFEDTGYRGYTICRSF